MPRHPPYALSILNPGTLHVPAPTTQAFGVAYLRITESICQGTHPGDQDSGVSRIRTGDPLLAKQVLYQLSYNPA